MRYMQKSINEIYVQNIMSIKSIMRYMQKSINEIYVQKY